jgi:peptidoglycan hydrolase CwlO-like protein
MQNLQTELEDIACDVNNLKKSIEILNEMVHEQQPEIDSIESFIEFSKEDALEAKRELARAKSHQDSYTLAYITGGIIFTITAMQIIMK